MHQKATAGLYHVLLPSQLNMYSLRDVGRTFVRSLAKHARLKKNQKNKSVLGQLEICLWAGKAKGEKHRK